MTADYIDRLRAKAAKVAALADDPRTPEHEAAAATERWWELAHQLRRMELRLGRGAL